MVMKSNIQDDPRTFKTIGAAMTVHRELGCGFLEPVYQGALSIEFKDADIPFEKEKEFPIFYKGSLLSKKYVVDFVCFGSVIVEVKALSHLSGVEESQVINYLKVSELNVGLLINFGERSLDYKRIVFNQKS